VPADGEKLVIGDITYTWRTSLVTTASPNDLKIQVDASHTRDLLVEVINQGSVTDAQPGTLPHPAVTASSEGVSTGTTKAAATLTINVDTPHETNLHAGATVTVGDKTLTAVSSGATGDQFNLGANQQETLDNIITAMNAASSTVTADARQGNSAIFRADTGGEAGNAIVVGKNTGGYPSDHWLKWTDANGAATTTLKNGSSTNTYRLRITARRGQLDRLERQARPLEHLATRLQRFIEDPGQVGTGAA